LWAVVNNAGISGGIGSINLHSRKDYDDTLAVNLLGVIMVTKACLQSWKRDVLLIHQVLWEELPP
jgi:NAD(P)-dependent dehydrogenase (short-subunit alcohol dehydrogenase family)